MKNRKDKDFETAAKLAAEKSRAEWEAQTGNPHFQFQKRRRKRGRKRGK